LLLSGLYLVLKERFYWGAFFLGLSVFAKIPNLLLAGVILLYAGFVILREATEQTFISNKLIVLASTIAIFIVALIPLAYINYRLFGSPVVTGYQRTAIAGGAGQLVLMDHTSSFNQPFLKGVYLMLLDRHNGLIPTGPIILLAIPGLLLLRQVEDRKKIYLILTICLIQFAFFSKYDYLNATGLGNRFLMTFVALSSVFVSNFFSWAGRRLYQPHPAQNSISAANGPMN
jgi:hypothetical protein